MAPKRGLPPSLLSCPWDQSAHPTAQAAVDTHLCLGSGMPLTTTFTKKVEGSLFASCSPSKTLLPFFQDHSPG